MNLNNIFPTFLLHKNLYFTYRIIIKINVEMAEFVKNYGNKMKGIFLGLALLLSFSSYSFGSENNLFVTYSYEGLGSCGEYIDQRRKGLSPGMKGWLRGYMTAVNSFVEGKLDYFEEVDDASLFLWVESWCYKNPTHHFITGLREFLRTQGVDLQSPF